MSNDAEAIMELLASAKGLPNLPGIYHMLDANDHIIYVKHVIDPRQIWQTFRTC